MCSVQITIPEPHAALLLGLPEADVRDVGIPVVDGCYRPCDLKRLLMVGKALKILDTIH